MVVTLIGYRGSGKSSVAAPLASRLGWSWIDADTEIESRAGQTIREIFAASGESGFRALERDVLAELLKGDELVLAAGGGAILDRATRDQMRAAGPVVWLKAGVDSLGRRIEADRTTSDRRPSLTATGGPGEIQQILSEREPLYRQCATLTVETDGRTVDEIAAELAETLTNSGGGPLP